MDVALKKLMFGDIAQKNLLFCILIFVAEFPKQSAIIMSGILKEASSLFLSSQFSPKKHSISRGGGTNTSIFLHNGGNFGPRVV